ncbi:MAG: hypothetical protein MK052_01140 [Alphaproteobacteria bacterium]|nr:hypothetical protein [Alphaproteobacteria bacterium]
MADKTKNAVASAVSEHVDGDAMVYYGTGINPQAYPCARAGIIHLYQQREEISSLGKFHPKRIFAWVLETSSYYMMRFVDFLKGLFNRGSIERGIQGIQSMAKGGNPLKGMDGKVEGWMSDLSPKGEFVLKRKMHNTIRNTTNEDGSCK